MDKKEKILIFFGVLLILVTACVGRYYLRNDQKLQKNPTNEEKLENFEKETLTKNETHFIDETEALNEGEIETIQKDVSELLNKFYGTIFQFSAETKDYTDQLKGYYGSGNLYKTSDIGEVGNIYALFQGAHMQSDFEDYRIERIIYRKNTKVPEISVIGSIQASFQSDKLENGKYSVISNIVLMNEGGNWKIFSNHISNVYEQNKMTAYKDKKDSLHDGLTYKGTVLDVFDFNDVEGYLTDYTYGDKEVKEVKESGLTVLD